MAMRPGSVAAHYHNLCGGLWLAWLGEFICHRSRKLNAMIRSNKKQETIAPILGYCIFPVQSSFAWDQFDYYNVQNPPLEKLAFWSTHHFAFLVAGVMMEQPNYNKSTRMFM